MKQQDERVSLTTEGLNNIKMLKLYSWADFFTVMIGKVRVREVAILRKRLVLGIFVVSLLYFFPALLQAVSFTAYIGSGNTMSVDKAFAILTIFNIIGTPLRMLPNFIGQCVEFHVSIRRLERFFAQEEINQSVKSIKPSESDVSLHGNWLWGLSSKQDAEKEHKDVLKMR